MCDDLPRLDWAHSPHMCLMYSAFEIGGKCEVGEMRLGDYPPEALQPRDESMFPCICQAEQP